MGKVAAVDIAHLAIVRASVAGFLSKVGRAYDTRGALLLDVAPQDHSGAGPYFPQTTIETLDINPLSGATYIADLCACNSAIESDRFDYVVCTEVLEHTLQPFAAVSEIERILKPGGLAFVTTPFDLRIHGPLPDCWRFTEYGLRALFSRFHIVELSVIEQPGRFLMPVHHTMIARESQKKPAA